jgi:hypothetical protein
VSPDKGQRRAARRSARPGPAPARPSPDDTYEVVYFRRPDDPSTAAPARDFLNTCPAKVRAHFRAVVTAVAAAPPHRFAGGGKWEAMRGEMAGIYEVRVDGPARHHYRLFCLLDTRAVGRGPLLVLLCGADKPFRTTLSSATYADVRGLRDEYLSRNPRSVI